MIFRIPWFNSVPVSAFSICILAHNNADQLPAALESVRAQSAGDWECIISDDASEDHTAAVVEPWLREDKRFRFFQQEKNLRQAGNWAFALGHAKGNFLTTLHADDCMEPDALESYLAAFERGRDLVWANWGYFDDTLLKCLRPGPVRDIQLEGDDVIRWIVRNNHTLPSATAFSRELAAKAGQPTDRCGIFCDRDYFLLLAAASRSAEAIGRQLVRYRQHANSVTADSTFTGTLQRDMMKLGRSASRRFASLPDGPALANTLRRQCGETVLNSAWDAILHGRFRSGLRWAADAISLSGWSLAHPLVLISLVRATKARTASCLK